MLVDVKYISLPNLIMDQPVVKELIQNDLTTKNISEELQKLLKDKVYRQNILNNYNILKNNLGGIGASKRLAIELFNDVSQKN